MENTNMEKEFDLRCLVKALKKGIVWIIIVALLCGIGAALFGAFVMKPTYQATASFWVSNTSSDYDYTSQAQTAAAVAIAASCVELVNQYEPIRTAVKADSLDEELGYPDENSCIKALRSMISAKRNDENSFIFYVTVKAASPEAVSKIINALQKTLPQTVVDLMGLRYNQENTSMITRISSAEITAGDVTMNKTSPVSLFILASVLSAILVYLAFVILTVFDTAVYDESILQDNFDEPVIGTVPTLSDDDGKVSRGLKFLRKSTSAVNRNYENKLLSRTSPFAVTESFNTLRTNVIFSAGATKSPVIAVTSGFSGVGKSLMSANLAMSLTDIDKKVLLVECDMRCPSFTKLFGKSPEAGLAELLAGMKNKTEEVTESVGKDNLDVIFCGKIPPNPSVLLSSERMAELVGEWKEKYDYIILDMPPVCEVVDAGVVSSLVNGYVLTVRCNYSDIKDVKFAVKQLQSMNGFVMGFILNDIRPKKAKKLGYNYSTAK